MFRVPVRVVVVQSVLFCPRLAVHISPRVAVNGQVLNQCVVKRAAEVTLTTLVRP